MTHPASGDAVDNVPNLGSRFVLDATVGITVTVSADPSARVVLIIESGTGVQGHAVPPDAAIQLGNQLREAGMQALIARSKHDDTALVD